MIKIFCFPETREKYGGGHLIRQSTLVKYLRSQKTSAFLCLPQKYEHPNVNYKFSLRLKKEYNLFYNLNEKSLKKICKDNFIIVDSYDTEFTKKILKEIESPKQVFLFNDSIQKKPIEKKGILIIPNILLSSENSNNNFLSGKNFVILDPIFLLTKNKRKEVLKIRLNRLKNCLEKKKELKILLSFGGSDQKIKKKQISLILHFLEKIKVIFNIQIFTLGKTAENIMHSFKAKIINLEWMDIKDLKKTYLDIDFYIGSIGYSMWERASMILPSFVIPITANQKHYLQVGEEIGVHKKIPENLNFSAVELINILGNIQISSKKLSFNLNGYKKLFVNA